MLVCVARGEVAFLAFQDGMENPMVRRRRAPIAPGQSWVDRPGRRTRAAQWRRGLWAGARAAVPEEPPARPVVEVQTSIKARGPNEARRSLRCLRLHLTNAGNSLYQFAPRKCSLFPANEGSKLMHFSPNAFHHPSSQASYRIHCYESRRPPGEWLRETASSPSRDLPSGCAPSQSGLGQLPSGLVGRDDVSRRPAPGSMDVSH